MVCMEWILCFTVVTFWMWFGFKAEDSTFALTVEGPLMIFGLSLSSTSLVFLLLAIPELVMKLDVEDIKNPFNDNYYSIFAIILKDSIFGAPSNILLIYTFFDLLDIVTMLDPIIASRSGLDGRWYVFENFALGTTTLSLLVLPIAALFLAFQGGEIFSTKKKPG